MPLCQLKSAPPPCDFTATVGASVTLEADNIVGNVTFANAIYAGTSLTLGKTITFVVIAGNQNLDLTLAFDNVKTGVGDIREVCDANQFISRVVAGNPFQRFTICGTAA